jgi:hypothetical protein
MRPPTWLEIPQSLITGSCLPSDSWFGSRPRVRLAGLGTVCSLAQMVEQQSLQTLDLYEVKGTA